MSEQQQRMAAVETDKELSDLLDFSAVRQWGSRLGNFWVALGSSIVDGVFGVGVWAGFWRSVLGRADRFCIYYETLPVQDIYAHCFWYSVWRYYSKQMQVYLRVFEIYSNI